MAQKNTLSCIEFVTDSDIVTVDLQCRAQRDLHAHILLFHHTVHDYDISLQKRLLIQENSKSGIFVSDKKKKCSFCTYPLHKRKGMFYILIKQNFCRHPMHNLTAALQARAAAVRILLNLCQSAESQPACEIPLWLAVFAQIHIHVQYCITSHTVTQVQ